MIDRTWKPGYSIQMAIGQGQILVTPLQMARVYAMIANGGKLVTPHLADDVEVSAANGPRRVLRRFGAQPPEPTGVDPTALPYVQRGLEEATQSPLGTSFGVFGNFPVEIAGKTGIAEKEVTLPGYPTPQNLTQSWWCGYGPYTDPSIVVCAVIENGGHGGTAAAPAALKVFEQYFDKHGHHERAPLRLMAIEAVDSAARGLRPRRQAPAIGAGALVRRLDWLLLAALAALVVYGLWAIDGITHARPGRLGGAAAGALRARRALLFVVVLFVDPDDLPAAPPADLLRDARRDAARARRGAR